MPAKLLYKLLQKKVRDIDMNLVLWIWSTRTPTQTKVLVLILTFFQYSYSYSCWAKYSYSYSWFVYSPQPWGERWKSQSGCNILSTHMPFFRSMSIGHPIPEVQHFQNLTLKIQGQGHGWGGHCKSQHGSNILLTHIPFIPCQSAIPFLRNSFLKIWPWKSKVKVMGEVNIESHSMGPTFYRLISLSFYVNRPSHSWDMSFSKSALKIQGQGHGWGERWKSQSGCNILSTHMPFVLCQSALPFLRYSIFKIWPWKSPWSRSNDHDTAQLQV